MCFSPPQGMTPKTHERILDTHPVPGQPPKFVYVYVFLLRERKSSPKFSCMKFPNPGRPGPNPGHAGHSLSKTTAKGHLHKVVVRDILTSWSLMSQECPAQKLYLYAVFPFLTSFPDSERVQLEGATRLGATEPRSSERDICL